MPRNRTVLGNNRIISTQNCVMSAMASFRRNTTQCTQTINNTDRCIGCDQTRGTGTEENILRCALLPNKFAWLCPTCFEA